MCLSACVRTQTARNPYNYMITGRTPLQNVMTINFRDWFFSFQHLGKDYCITSMFIITWTVSTPRHVEWRESRSMFCETKHVLKFKQIVKKAWRYNTEKYNNQTMKFTYSAIRPTLFCCEFVRTIHVRSVM